MGWGLSKGLQGLAVSLRSLSSSPPLHLHCHSLHPGHQHPCPGPLTTLQWIVPWPCRMQPGGWMRVKKKCRGHKLVCTFRHGRPSEARVPSGENLNSWDSPCQLPQPSTASPGSFSISLSFPWKCPLCFLCLKAPSSKISSLLLIPIHLI